ncbi:hypothetical protein SAMN02745247_02343 [Butyrivibrio hungatei DSM 14810]|uniref:FtsK/SpoIIIE family protein n=2 Tax=Butyrivibrio hungatei TaxID=185008 RepID=A0A1M7SS01_9FIRM|nr:hypothetical protein SAMN02745247_02343 [Butyrivibrio hungatei DSM 14810]
MIYGYLYDLWYSAKMKVPIKHNLSSHCHVLLTGSSGSGKSYALLYILGRLMQTCPNITVYFCDFKNSDDFSFLDGYKHYYSGDECYNGIIAYYKSFTSARKNRSKRRALLIFDEYPAFISYLSGLDKTNKTKRASECQNAVAEILMLGRGINHGIWLVTQRADASLFQGSSGGSRDNFMIVIGLGRMSREQKGMLFSGEDLPNDRIYKPGEGIIYADGSAIQEIKIPIINNLDSWKHHIISIMFASLDSSPSIQEPPSCETSIREA